MTAIYRTYDRAALDAQYDNRRRVAESAQHLERFAAESARVRRELPARLDVPYGPAPGETLDVFPAAHGGGPVWVYIHGGFWRALDKGDFSFLAPAFVQAGASLVSVNYTLAPAATLDEIVRQCRAAVAWCWRNARSFGGDPDRVYVSGWSAGGHLVAMMAETDWPAFAEDLPPDPIAGGCAISGVYDVEPIRLCYLNDSVHLDEPAARRNSPLFHLPPRGTDLILAVGGRESEEFLRQNRAMASAWRGAGFPCLELELAGKDHFTVIAEMTQPGNALTQAVLRQMRL